MEDCELCGRGTETVYVVSVEDVEFRVCPSCAKGKKIVSEPNNPRMHGNNSKRFSRDPRPEDSEPELIDGYGNAIRDARNRLKMPLKVLAELINEKETFLSRVEEEKTEPPIALIKKLEKTLSINLMANSKSPESKTHSIGQSGKVTLGDYAGNK